MSEEVADMLHSENVALHLRANSHSSSSSIMRSASPSFPMSPSTAEGLRLLQTAILKEDHLPLGTAVAWTLGGAVSAAALLAVLAVPTMYNKSKSDSKSEAKETDALLAEKGAAGTNSTTGLSDADTASCVSWQPGGSSASECEVEAASPTSPASPPGAAEQSPKPGATLVTSAMLMAVPSVLGVWCWPLLLVTAFGVSSQVATLHNRERMHHFTLGADVVLFTGIILYVACNSNAKSKTWTSRWLPTILVALGSLFMLCDPVRHVLLDHGGVFFEEQTLAMYADNQGHLTHMGRFSQVSTILGIILLIGGVVMFLRLPETLLKKYPWIAGSPVA